MQGNVEDGEIVEAEVEAGEVLEENDEASGHEMPVMEPGSCPHCRQLSEEEQCIRTVPVAEHRIGKNLNGCIMTFAPVHDRVQPKASKLSAPVVFKVEAETLTRMCPPMILLLSMSCIAHRMIFSSRELHIARMFLSDVAEMSLFSQTVIRTKQYVSLNYI